MQYSWKYSLIAIPALIISVIIYAAAGGLGGIETLSSAAVALIDMRMWIVCLFFMLQLKFVNPIVLSILAGVVYKAYLHLTLGEIWKELGKSFEFIDGLLGATLGAFVIISLAHVLMNAFSQSKKSEENNQ